MEQLKIYKCFISSPGDCSEERKICKEVISEINQNIERLHNIKLDTFMWEEDVLPDMGKNGQEIIDEYVEKSNYDVFIGIMKNRFGQPTLKAGSGTEHEFNDALRRKQEEKDTPQILFFFGSELINPNDLDIEQFKKVQEFKENIKSKGVYIDFKDKNEFRNKLKIQLQLFVKKIANVEDDSVFTDETLNKLEKDLKECLRVYNEDTPIWIEPIISYKKDIPNNPTNNVDYQIRIEEIIDSPKNIIIKAPSEFGLTSLAHKLKLDAWKKGKIFVYIDSKTTKRHKVLKDILKELKECYNETAENKINCILLDSICFEESGVMQIIKNICEEYKSIPLIIFNTTDNSFFLKSDEDDKVEIKREFVSYYILPLAQNDVRKIVHSYSKNKNLEDDDDVILAKVTKDLEVLNLHRTPKNCISILRASSKIESDYSPVNRTKLLEIILETIFREYDLPDYRDKKPDIKDCSFILGYLCEYLVKHNNFEFSKDTFKSVLQNCCKSHFIDVDLDYLFNVLCSNGIFSRRGETYYFKNSYWVFYFIAQRMNMNKEFLDFVYENKKYIDYPEIIEFYTGIDRQKNDALELLKKDILETIQIVRAKVNIPEELNPYKTISWNPDIKKLEEEEAKIGENVISSGLPDEVKDKYDDKSYNQVKPYNQVINNVIREYSFQVLMRQISAISRALRNSDYADVSLKREVLGIIMEAWNEINKLLIVLSPLLADRGNISFEGASFYLDEEDFDILEPMERRLAVLLAVPTNVVRFFKDDLFSMKMGSLLIDKFENEKNDLIKYELVVLLVAERPKNWYVIVEKYIEKLNKNSFYLSDILRVINFNINYKVTESNDRRLLSMLMKKCNAKHIFNKSRIDQGLLNKLW